MADWSALADGLIDTGKFVVRDALEQRSDERKARILNELNMKRDTAQSGLRIKEQDAQNTYTDGTTAVKNTFDLQKADQKHRNTMEENKARDTTQSRLRSKEQDAQNTYNDGTTAVKNTFDLQKADQKHRNTLEENKARDDASMARAKLPGGASGKGKVPTNLNRAYDKAVSDLEYLGSYYKDEEQVDTDRRAELNAIINGLGNAKDLYLAGRGDEAEAILNK